MAAVLLVGAGLLLWAGNFATSSVAQQLSDQRITMPAGAAIADPQMKPHLEQNAGQPLTTGAQAQAYADHFILIHMNAASQGKIYGAFGTLGTIAIYAAIASVIGAAAMATLALLGWRHLRRVPAAETVRLGGRAPVPALG